MSNKKQMGINPIIDEIKVGDIDKLYQEELKRVLKDEKLLNMLLERGITKDMVKGNLGNILDFEDTHLECENFHKKHGDKPCNTQIVELQNIAGAVVRQLGQCPHQIRLDKMRMRYLYHDFPSEWIKNRMSTIDMQKNRASLVSELLNMKKGDKAWIYVYGMSGRGKAFIVVSALNDIAELNKEATFAFVDYPQLVADNMVDYYNNRARVDQVVQSLIDVDYLVLNNFGNEELSDIVKSALTMPLLSNRDANQKTTILISQISLDELEQLHKSGKNNLVRARQLVNIIRDNIKSPINLVGAKIYN